MAISLRSLPTRGIQWPERVACNAGWSNDRGAVPAWRFVVRRLDDPRAIFFNCKQSLFASGGGMEFWTESQMASIHMMLNPRSIAIVGATPRMQYGGRFLAAALKAKDRVRVYAVNPSYDEIMGGVCYTHVKCVSDVDGVGGN